MKNALIARGLRRTPPQKKNAFRNMLPGTSARSVSPVRVLTIEIFHHAMSKFSKFSLSM